MTFQTPRFSSFLKNGSLFVNVDKSLIDKCIKQERKAQFELYKQCYAFMMKICLRYHKNDEDAKEIVNQAFLKVCDHLEKYESKAPFALWLRRITINTVIDNFRRNKKHKDHLEYSDFEQPPPSGNHVSFNEGAQDLDADALRAMIRTLPETSQQIFNLCILDGYSYEEVADMLQVSEATCRWHVFNSRKVLRTMIEKSSKTEKTMVS